MKITTDKAAMPIDHKHVVWKYHLEIQRKSVNNTLAIRRTQMLHIRMPWEARPLSCGAQNSEIVVWAKVNPENPLCTHRFMVISTGQHAPQGVFLGTVDLSVPDKDSPEPLDIPYAAHIFYLGTEP